MNCIISPPHVFYLLIDCNGALLSLFQVSEAVVQHMISNDVYLHLDFISNSHNCGFGLNVLSDISATITWRFLICTCWGGVIHNGDRLFLWEGPGNGLVLWEVRCKL